MTKLNIKREDMALVIAGKEKGKKGKVLEVYPDKNYVLIENVNVVSKHQKARSQKETSSIVKKSAPLEISNVQVLCPTCGKATRVAHKEIDKKNVRICKKCGASLDHKMKKLVKKTNKTEEKAPKQEKAVAEKKTTAKTTKQAPKAIQTAKAKGTNVKAPKTDAVKKTTTVRKTVAGGK